RRDAEAELEKLGEDAEASLRELLRRPGSLEARLRAERLLKKLDGGPTLGRLRELRALEVLEQAGTPEARRLLAELAKGAEGAWLTGEAEATLKRLSARFPTR